MAWTLDKYSFDTVDGQLDKAVPVDSELVRPGVDGTSFHVHAWRSTSQTLTATARKTTSEVSAFVQGCYSLQTKTVVLADQFASRWTVYVRRVRITLVTQIDGTYLVRCAWTLVPRSERPA